MVLDPEIAGEKVTILRRQGTVNANGEQQTAVTSFPNVPMSVTPTGSNSLVREEAYDSQTKSIRVISQAPLRSRAEQQDGTDWLPDVIQWKGGNYIVRIVDDYSSFGAGMIVADCLLFDFIPPPPTMGNTS
jgi:hypothetical protein